MRHRTTYKIAFILTAIGLFLCPPVLMMLPKIAEGTSDYMIVLPTYQKFQCANCHISPTPAPESHELNPFGLDFKANGYLWDPVLALKNSDDDLCSNGFELCDSDGDGIIDQLSVTVEHSNPGNSTDCSIALTKETWGIIKQIFSGETQTPSPPD